MRGPGMRLAALMFLAGAVVVQQLSSLPSVALIVVPAVGVGLLCRQWGGDPLRGLLWLLLGCAWAVWHGQSVLGERLATQLENRTINVSGTVLSPVNKPGLSRFLLLLDTDQAALPDRVRIAWYEPSARPGAGERWRLRVRLRRPVGFSNPGGFDYERWLFRQGIGATGYVLNSGENVRLGGSGGTPVAWRETISTRVARLTRDLEYGAIIRALTVGDRSGMEAGHWNTLNATGTNHLLAISGLHVGLVAVFGFAAGGRLWARLLPVGIRRSQLAAIVGLSLAFAYAALSGFAIPAQRAVFMVAGALLAVISGRTVTPGQFLGGALFVILVADPFAVLDTGLWLSFVAVSSILWVVRQRATGFFRQCGMVQGAVSLGLIPILLLFFQRLSLVAPLVNLFAIPVVAAIVVPLCLAGVAALILNDSLARGLWLLADRVIHLLWWILDNVAGLPGVLWTTPAPSVAGLSAGLLGVIALLGPLRRILWVPACVLLGFLLFATRDAPDFGQARVALLDVGQGLSVVVETSRHTLVYDAGPRFRSGFDTGSGVVAPYLRSRGINIVDLLVISHGDMDHRGGMAGLMDALPVQQVMFSNREPGSDAKTCTRGQRWTWDGVVFNLLHPPSGLFTGNNRSCVLHVATKGDAILLPGDIEKAAEAWLVENAGQDLEARLLVAPHHGSDTSSTAAFLDAVGPAFVLIPAGYGNRFGLPRPEVVARYESFGAQVFVSGCEGALIANMADREQVSIQGWRVAGERYWTLQPCAGKDTGQIR